MRVQFIGSGDAFGSGGRLNTCFLVEAEACRFLIDCGASSMIGLKGAKVDRNSIRMILITHFHLDHFGGIPPFILDARFFAKRSGPLTIAGPPGLPEWYERVMETAFPGSAGTNQRFPLELVELAAGKTRNVCGVSVTAAQVNQGKPGGPFFGYRVAADDRVVAYTGDTEWTDTLVDLGRGADLFIAEAYFHRKQVRLHLDLASLEQNLDRIRPRRLILTHMSDEMLAQVDRLPYQTAHDGLTVEV